MTLVDIQYGGPEIKIGNCFAWLFHRRIPPHTGGKYFGVNLYDISKQQDDPSLSTFRVILNGEEIFHSSDLDPDYVRMTNMDMIDTIARIKYPPSTTIGPRERKRMIEITVIPHVISVPVPDQLPDLGPYSPPSPILALGMDRHKRMFPRTVIIEHTGHDAPPMFRRKAEEIRDGLLAAVEQIEVGIHGQVKRPGCFVVREMGGRGRVFVKLLDMMPPEFYRLRKLPVHDVVFGVGNAILNDMVFDRYNNSP